MRHTTNQGHGNAVDGVHQVESTDGVDEGDKEGEQRTDCTHHGPADCGCLQFQLQSGNARALGRILIISNGL